MSFSVSASGVDSGRMGIGLSTRLSAFILLQGENIGGGGGGVSLRLQGERFSVKGHEDEETFPLFFLDKTG